MQFEIEDGIVPPVKHSRGPNVLKYPFKQLKVGQSFMVSQKERDTPGLLIQRIRNAAFRASKATKFEYLIRPWEQGVRVWRLK